MFILINGMKNVDTVILQGRGGIDFERVGGWRWGVNKVNWVVPYLFW